MPAVVIWRRMRASAPLVAAFGAGLAAAWAAWMAVLPMYEDTIITCYRIEQGLLADRAAARGDRAEEERQRRNVIATFSREGFKTITSDAEALLARATVPPAMLVLSLAKADSAPADPIDEALERGRLALALERAGRTDAANAEWTQALQMFGRWDLPRFRAMIENIAAIDTVAAQDAVLGRADD
jgi:hypothetical protein